MTAGRPGASGSTPRRSRAPKGPRDSNADLVSRIEALEAGLEQALSRQETQFVQLMKFVVLRHISTLALMIDQGPAPARIAADARLAVDEGAQRITKAATLDEVKEVDLALQQQLRQVIAAFKAS